MPRKKKIEDMDIETIKRRLKSRYNIEDDEVAAVAGKGETALREFYKQTLKLKSARTISNADGEGVIPKDTYTLPKGKKKIAAQLTPKEEKAKSSFEQGAAPLDHLPAAERVSYEDILKSMEDLTDD